MLLYVAGDSEEFADDLVCVEERGHRSVVLSRVDEDYSTCHWPVVIKVQRGYSADYVADRLDDLVAKLRREGLSHEVPEELPEPARKAAREDVRRLGLA